ncbi:MAG: malto-oligosyltrehalose synthase, partial [Thermoguttaceae bacterium]
MNDLHALADRITDDVCRRISEPRHWPTSTYRLQFRGDQLTFRDAAALVPYLDRLGISHIYASPYLKARQGSPHGYDVVDYGRLNPDLGSEDDYAAMVEALRGHGMGQILDIVPNHMGIVPGENAWWTDVLENGPSSPYASYFDVDWHPVKAELENKVLLPLLEDQYGKVLEAGQLRLEYGEGAFFLRYAGKRLPLDPRSFGAVLAPQIDPLKETLGPDSEAVRELQSILTALDYLPKTTETAPERVAERQREKEVVKGRLHRLAGECLALAARIEESLGHLNGNPGDPHSFDPLDALLNAQVYRLSYWRAADDEINYRRFFDVNDLAAVSTEAPQAFEAIHRFVLDLLVRGKVDGLRIDHIDGLFDPQEYLRRLQRGYLRAMGLSAYDRVSGDPQAGAPPAAAAAGAMPAAEAPPWRWEEVEPWFLRKVEGDLPADRPLPLYVVVEKILGPEEPLPANWPVAGTTGYTFLSLVNRLLVDPAGLAELDRTYQRFIGERLDVREVAYQSKRMMLGLSMSSELQLLAHRLNRISERHRGSRDYTLNTLRIALREILACFPVYRTYIRPGEVSERDRQVVQRAVAQARRRNPAAAAAVFEFVRDVLLLEQPPDLDDSGRRDREVFVGRFQQVTSPLVAKGIEDTAFYVYLPLVSLCEVGSDPARGAATIEEFHAASADRLREWPQSLIATTTHDTKRSEDVRARMNVLSEVPHLWRAAVNRWARVNRRHRREADGLPAPSRNDEYLFYQTLVGVWPLEPP